MQRGYRRCWPHGAAFVGIFLKSLYKYLYICIQLYAVREFFVPYITTISQLLHERRHKAIKYFGKILLFVLFDPLKPPLPPVSPTSVCY